MQYAERLTVPLRWWVQGTMLVATLWLAVAVAMPALGALAVTAVAGGLLAGGFLWYGGARITVANGELRAGRAHIAIDLVGTVQALDAEATRRTAGVEADARAYLVLRPYLKRSVRVEITDPSDPAPYWLICTRHPDRLMAALTASSHRDDISDAPAG